MTAKRARARRRPDPWIEAEDMLARIQPGDRVTILVPGGIGREGSEYVPRTGRAVMRGPHGWALDMGGRHGTPGVATAANVVSVRHASKPSRATHGART